MTFEEFFNKKRIDLGLMRDADPALYSEFKSHFESMGEKSFDHTKKFWFNKLRHLYHLAESAKKVATQLETQIASQAEPLSSPTIEQSIPALQPQASQEPKTPVSAKPGFRPRSIAAAAVKKQEQPTDSKADASADKPATPVSKPGFKPRNIKPVSGELSEDVQKTASRPGQEIPSGASQGNTANTPRPAYKPRFNAGKLAENTENAERNKQEAIEGTAKENASADEVQHTGEPGVSAPAAATPGEHSAPDSLLSAGDAIIGSDAAHPADTGTVPPTKPAYKPRFNSKTTARKDVQEENPEHENPSAGVSVTNENNPPLPEPADEAAKPQAENGDRPLEEGTDHNEAAKAAVPKPAYKPRFNVKTIAAKTAEEPPVSSSEQAADSVESPSKSQESTTEAPEEPAKPAYKPRFNMKNIKPKE
ncbi:hypothetical protein [Arcticibacter sp.]|uniref:hypothetical protein n=1 Tax=Arcticibacter sp. TaxID=1872630 RepID=UPI003890FF41